MTKKIVITSSLAVILCVVIAIPIALSQEVGQVLTLEEALEFAIENNPDIGFYRSTVKLREAQVSQTRANLLPQISGTFIIPFVEAESGIRYDQLIWDFWKTPNLIKHRKKNVTASEYDVDSETLETVLDTKVAYYRALAARHDFEASRKLLESKEKRLGQYESFYEQGRISRLEFIRAKVDAGNARLESLTAKNNLDKARLELARAIGWEGDFTPMLEDMLEFKPIYIELDSAIERAIRMRPDIRSLMAKEAGERARHNASTREFAPTIVARVAYRFGGEGADEPNFIAGAGVKVPIFDGFSKFGRVKETRALLSRTRHELRALKQRIEVEVNQLYLDMNFALESIEVAKESQNSAEENYELIREQYRLGTSSKVELLEAEALLESTKADYAGAIYDYRTAVAKLERALGEKLE